MVVQSLGADVVHARLSPARAGGSRRRARTASRRRPAAPSVRATRGVIGVEPGHLAGIEQLALDQPPVDRRERQRLEGVERLLGAGDLRPSTTSTRFSMRMP